MGTALDELLRLPIHLRFGFDGDVLATSEGDEALLPYLQAPALPPSDADNQLKQLKLQYLEPDLDAILGDVSYCGEILCWQPGAPIVQPECSPPTYIVTPTLPMGPCNDHSIGWEEHKLSAGDLMAQGLHKRLISRHAAREEGWRGFAVSTPYLPGASADASQLTAAAAAAQGVPADNRPEVLEAQSGLWLAQLQSGKLPQVAPPGLSRGVFGGWQQEAQEVSVQQAELQSQLQQKEGRMLSRKAAAPATAAEAAEGLPTSTGGASGVALPVSYRVDQAAELRGVFDDVWMLGLDDGTPAAGHAEHEDESEEEEEEEAQEPTATQQGAVPGLPELPIIDISRQATSVSTHDEVDEILAAADKMVTAALTKTAPQAAPGGRGARPVLGATPGAGLAGGNTEWAVRSGVPDLDTAWAAVKPRLAAQYPFELDVFQKEAIIHMESGHSVFVAAHTSAGKTVVAEYAFALATQHCTRAIYTSPIKTISNQKYRDLSAKFDVGLLTGDVQMNPTAPCLIMTTEILRSMLYRGADLIRDVEWVVFDEVHYVNDADRGVVWEEVIIMLPPHVGLVMLSATVPNLMDFADWVGRTKRKVIYVTGTMKRPVPLQHSLFYNGELYTVCSSEAINSDGLRQAQQAHKTRNEPPPKGGSAGVGGRGPAGQQQGRGAGQGGQAGRGAGRAGGQQGGRGGSGGRGQAALAGALRSMASPGPNAGGFGERQQMLDLIQLLKKKSMLPMAVFCFSKKRCDSAASALNSLDLTTASEKHTAHVFLEKVLGRLKEGDRQLPQITRLRGLIKRGLAVHHAGLLPVMKEAVEMLFCQGYIKVLFCTETFAMGVNAPTRTVVFHSLRKHDGREFRYLLPGEYTQMAGRAGRRGLDQIGHVIIACWDDIPEEGVLRSLLVGRGVSLGSQFRLTYSMIVNMMRVEDLKVEDMLKRSFAEWQAQRAAPKAAAGLAAVNTALTQLRALPWPGCAKGCTMEQVQEYYNLGQEIDKLTSKVQEVLFSSKQAQAALTPGRLVLWQNPVSGITEPAIYLGDTPDSCKMHGKADKAKVGLGGKPAAGLLSPRGGTSSSTGPAAKRVALLAIHAPGKVDSRHLAELKAQRDSKTPTSAKQAPADDMFAGMVLVGGGKGRGGAGGGAGAGPGPLPRYGTAGGIHYVLADAALSEVVDISKAKIKVDPAELLSGDWGSGDDAEPSNRVKTALSDALRAAQKEASGTLPLLDVRSDLRLNDLDTSQQLDRRAALLTQQGQLPPAGCAELSEQYSLVRAIAKLEAEQKRLQHELSDASLQALPEFETRVRVLQRLGYLDAERAVTLKGRVLCEINSSQDELISSELILSGVLESLSPAEAVALISALVFQEKSEVEPSLPPALAEARDKLTQLALATAQVAVEEGLPVDPAEVVATALHPGLMEVVHQWALGTPFAEICGLTDVMEGSIVRAVVRLDQMCRELQDAARVMGNTALFTQMQAASAAIKRDVVFAASLYIA